MNEGLTQEMISHSTQRDLPLELGVTQYLSTDGISPSVRNHNLSRRDVDDAFGKASLEFGVESLRNRRQDLDSR